MRKIVGAAIVGVLVVLLVSQGTFAGSDSARRLTVTVLSGRPDTVTGGEAVILVTAPADLPLGQVQVWVDGRDVTSRFRPDPDVHGLTAVVNGLRQSRIDAAASGAGAAILRVADHPITGPVFS